MPARSSVFGLECLDFEKSSYSQSGSQSPEYKYVFANQIPHQLTCPSQTIPDRIRYTVGVFCYDVKSQMNILALY